MNYQAWHVGKIRARCIVKLRCTSNELKLLKKFDPIGTHKREMNKPVPDRYPSNQDSIGIELVGQALPLSEPNPDKRIYEPLTNHQQTSLNWLLDELRQTIKVPITEIFKHPTVSYKNKTEAATAAW